MPVRPALRGLYAITPDQCDSERLLWQVGVLAQGGLRWLQYRNKSGSTSFRAEQAAALASLCKAKGIALIINDDVSLALAVDADGVHLGADDGDVAAARHALGADKVLGVSCYDDSARAHRAAAMGASYVAFGAMFASPTKPMAPKASHALLGGVYGDPGCAKAAIGGITMANAPTLIAAGADLLAVITDLFDAPDLEHQARRYQQLFD